MTLSGWPMAITLLMVVLGTMTTRFLPFIVFPAGKETPRFVQYLSQVLPYAAIGMLVIYCLKGVTLTAAPFGIPEAVGVAVTAAAHLWKRNMLLSIASGTAVYMVTLAIFAG